MPFDPELEDEKMFGATATAAGGFDPEVEDALMFGATPSPSMSNIDNRDARLAQMQASGLEYSQNLQPSTTPVISSPTADYLYSIPKQAVNLLGLAYSSVKGMLLGKPGMSDREIQFSLMQQGVPPGAPGYNELSAKLSAERDQLNVESQQDISTQAQQSINQVMLPTPYEAAPKPDAIMNATGPLADVKLGAEQTIAGKTMQAALGRPEIPLVNQEGYVEKPYSRAVQATTALVGDIIPLATIARSAPATAVLDHAVNVGKAFGILSGSHALLDRKALDEVAAEAGKGFLTGVAGGAAGGQTSAALSKLGARPGVAVLGSLVPEAAAQTITQSTLAGKAPTKEEFTTNLALSMLLHASGVAKNQIVKVVDTVDQIRYNRRYANASPDDMAQAAIDAIAKETGIQFSPEQTEALKDVTLDKFTPKSASEQGLSGLDPEAAAADILAAEKSVEQDKSKEARRLAKMTPLQILDEGIKKLKRGEYAEPQELLPETEAAIDELFKEEPTATPQVQLSERLSKALDIEMARPDIEQRAQDVADIENIEQGNKAAEDLAAAQSHYAPLNYGAPDPRVTDYGPFTRPGERIDTGEPRPLPVEDLINRTLESATQSPGVYDTKRFLTEIKANAPLITPAQLKDLGRLWMARARAVGEHPDVFTARKIAEVKGELKQGLNMDWGEARGNVHFQQPKLRLVDNNGSFELRTPDAKNDLVATLTPEQAKRLGGQDGTLVDPKDAKLEWWQFRQDMLKQEPSKHTISISLDPHSESGYASGLKGTIGVIDYGNLAEVLGRSIGPEETNITVSGKKVIELIRSIVENDQYNSFSYEKNQISKKLDRSKFEDEYTYNDAINQGVVDSLIDEHLQSPQYQNRLSPKAAVEFLDDGRAILYALKQSDVSSMIHEFSHIFRRDLSPAELAIAEKHFNVTGGNWTRENEEAFARSYERWTRVGRTANKDLEDTFKKFSKWMSEIYTTIKDSPLADAKLTPTISKFFDKLTSDYYPVEAELNAGAKEEAQAEAQRISTPAQGPTTLMQLSPSAQKVEDMFERADTESARLHGAMGSWDTFKRKFFHRVTGTSDNLSMAAMKQGPLGERTMIHHDLVAGSDGITMQRVQDGLKEVHKPLRDSADTQLMDRIISSMNLLEIGQQKPGVKRPEGLTLDEFRSYLKEKATEDPQRFMRSLRGAETYFRLLRENTIDRLLTDGYLDQAQYNKIRRSNYSPKQYLEYLDKNYGEGTVGGKSINVADDVVKRLKGGSEGLLEGDHRLLFAKAVAITTRTVMNNRANMAAVELARANPTNGMFGVLPVPKSGQVKVPPDSDVVYARENGQKVALVMPRAVAKEWLNTDPAIKYSLANWIGWLSGSKITKAASTGLNPFFAPANFPKDISYILMTTNEYSPALPVAAAQMSADLASVAKDAFFRTGEYKKATEQGMAMEFLSDQGLLRGRRAVGPLTVLGDILAYPGKTSEIITRLALRKRAIENRLAAETAKGNVITPEIRERIEREGTWVARNYLDFSKGGSWTKAVDSGVPYLNAAVQGSKGIFRAGAKNPAVFAFKVAQLAGGAAAIRYLANQIGQKDDGGNIMDDIPQAVQEQNFVMPLGKQYSYQDKLGQTRYYYIAVPKDEGQRVFSRSAEVATDAAAGRKYDTMSAAKQAAALVIPFKEFIPVPIFKAYAGYKTGYDLFFGEKRFPANETGSLPEAGLPGRSGEYFREFDPFHQPTNPALLALNTPGVPMKIRELSPEGINYFIQQFVPDSSMWAESITIAQQMAGMLPKDVQQKDLMRHLTETPGLRRYLRSTAPGGDRRDEIREAREKEKAALYIQRRGINP